MLIHYILVYLRVTALSENKKQGGGLFFIFITQQNKKLTPNQHEPARLASSQCIITSYFTLQAFETIVSEYPPYSETTGMD